MQKARAYNYIGSSSWIAIATSEPIYDPSLRTFTWAHLVPDMYSPCGTMQAAGGSYQWLRDIFCLPEKKASNQLHVSPYELMNLQVEQSPPGANNLLYIPYLLGERSPRWNPNARGVYFGLTVQHTRADIIRATMEGITFNLRVILEAFQEQGAKVDAIRVIGGGARGRIWRQVLAGVSPEASPDPSLEFVRQTRVFADNLEIRIQAPESEWHGGGDVVVFVPAEKVLMVGDLYSPGSFPEFNHETGRTSAAAWLEALRQVIDMVPLLKSAMPAPKPEPEKPEEEPKTLEELITVLPVIGPTSNLQEMKDLLGSGQKVRTDVTRAVTQKRNRETFLDLPMFGPYRLVDKMTGAAPRAVVEQSMSKALSKN